jgi:hypothetical protein
MPKSNERLVAMLAGEKSYFTGKPCKHGHIARRRIHGGCTTCAWRRTDKRRKNDFEFWLHWKIGCLKRHAKQIGVPFDLTVEYLLEITPKDFKCPVLGHLMTFAQKQNPNALTIDRLIASKGYVIGNVAVISNRANLIKTDATDPNELRAVAAYMDKFLCQSIIS